MCLDGPVLGPAKEIVMLFFELLPALFMVLLIPVGIRLVVMDRQSRQRPIEEQTTHVRIVSHRS